MYSNFLSEEEQCLPHLWYVSCLAQLTLFGIFFAWILSKSAKFGIFLIVIAVACCNAAVGIITLKNEFPPSYIAYFTENSSSLFWKINLALPLSHFGPYAAGMLTGILIARRIHHKIRCCVGGLGWIVCVGIIYGIVLVIYKYRDDSLSGYWSAVYASNHRTIFALCVAWVMIACSFGIGGFVNAILSWKVLDPLYRLSYYAFLFHFVLIATVVGVARERFFYSHLELLLRTVSYVGATYFISYFLFFLLEMPLKSLQAGLCPRRTRQIDVTPLNNFSSDKGYAYKTNTIQGSCKLWSITETHNGISY
ncbi:Nose resistant to fluoxetine protein 6, partial [Stegodyphus mimosarum]